MQKKPRLNFPSLAARAGLVASCGSSKTPAKTLRSEAGATFSHSQEPFQLFLCGFVLGNQPGQQQKHGQFSCVESVGVSPSAKAAYNYQLRTSLHLTQWSQVRTYHSKSKQCGLYLATHMPGQLANSKHMCDYHVMCQFLVVHCVPTFGVLQPFLPLQIFLIVVSKSIQYS